MNSLIVYFSHAGENYFSGEIKNIEVGNVKKTALIIKDILDVKMFELIEVDKYPTDYSLCTKRAKEELLNNISIAYKDDIDISDYDCIYLGFPNWWNTMPLIVRSFLENKDLSNKHIYPFCLHQGSGFGNSLNDLKKICPNSIIHKGLSLYEVNKENIERWVREDDR